MYELIILGLIKFRINKPSPLKPGTSSKFQFFKVGVNTRKMPPFCKVLDYDHEKNKSKRK
jgi:hypothetical protein